MSEGTKFPRKYLLLEESLITIPTAVIHFIYQYSMNKSLVLLGGVDNSTTEQLEYETNLFFPFISLPSHVSLRYGARAFFFQQKIYMIGGYLENSEGSYCYLDLLTSKFINLPANLEPRSFPNVWFYDNTIYIFGGQHPDTQSSVYTGEALDLFKAKEWIVLSCTMRHFRFSCGTVEYDNKLYLIGGLTDEYKLLNTCEFYDLNLQKFRPLPRLNHQRSEPAVCCSNDGIIYVFGGIGVDNLLENSFLTEYCEFFNLSTPNEGWKLFPSMKTGSRASATALFFGENIYVCGGIGINDTKIKKCEIYSPRLNNWLSTDIEMVSSRQQHSVCIIEA